MITIFTISYNEEFRIQFMLDHYRKRFNDCKIVLYDNMSTDNTVDIALKNNIEVIPFNTNDSFSDNVNVNIKNTSWKYAKTDWILTCDLDELIEVCDKDLIYEESVGTTIFSFDGYNMINMEDNYDIQSMKYGERCPPYDKSYLFNKKYVNEMNYTVGCHTSNPKGIIKYSKKRYLAYHYNFVNLTMAIDKYKQNSKRLSKENLDNGWGFHYKNSVKQITEEFYKIRKNAIKVR